MNDWTSMTEEEFKEEASQLVAVGIVIFMIGIAIGAIATIILLQ